MAKQFKKLALLFALVFVSVTATAQSITDIRINEVLHINNISADKNGWIELHNAGYSSINVGGSYLSIEKEDVAVNAYTIKDNFTYRIPTTSPGMTTIPPQGYLIVYVGSNSSLGPNYANFDLKEASNIYFADASGRIIVDEFIVNRNIIIPNISIGREVISYKEMLDLRKMEIPETYISYESPTPGAVNKEDLDETKSEQMIQKDPVGYGMAFIAMGVVFSALLILFIIFKCIGLANQKFEKRKEIKSKPQLANTITGKPDKHLEASGEVIAVIAFVLNQYRTDVDNMESNILTINKVVKSYSPWSSKIYGLTQLPNRK